MIAAFIVPQKRDFISRDDAKIAAWTILEGMGVSAKHNERLAEEVDAVVDDIPAADVRPVVRGKWEEVEVTWLEDVEDQPDAIASMFCPKCQRFANHVYHYGDPTSGMNYCPNCGADMREPPKGEK